MCVKIENQTFHHDLTRKTETVITTNVEATLSMEILWTKYRTKEQFLRSGLGKCGKL